MVQRRISQRMWAQNPGWSNGEHPWLSQCSYQLSIWSNYEKGGRIIEMNVQAQNSYCWSWIFRETNSLSCCWPLDLELFGSHLWDHSGNLENDTDWNINLRENTQRWLSNNKLETTVHFHHFREMYLLLRPYSRDNLFLIILSEIAS